jgi:DNA-directed RNA polymerase specialized sigma24 family protein
MHRDARGGKELFGDEPGAGGSRTDADLVQAVARGESAALAEFLMRFNRALRAQALGIGVPSSHLPQCVEEVIHDVAIHILRGKNAPANIMGYMIRSMRNRWIRIRREELRERRVAPPASVADVDGARCFSPAEVVHRVAEDQDGGDDGSVATRVWRELEKGLTADERRLAAAIAAGATHREIAAIFGITQAAAAKRAQRLFRRLRERATFLERQPAADEQSYLDRLLRPARTRSSSGNDPEETNHA